MPWGASGPLCRAAAVPAPSVVVLCWLATSEGCCAAAGLALPPLAVEWGQEVALVGAAEGLGSWDVEKSIPMSWNDGDMWTAQAEVPIE